MKLGLRPAARQLGISHVALLKAVEAGRVKRERDGSFDIEKCKKALKANSNPAKQRQARTQQRKESQAKQPLPATVAAPPEKVVVEPKASEPSPETFEDTGGGEDHPGSYSEALRQREWLRVAKEGLNLQKQRGGLVELGPIDAYVSGLVIKCRDELLRIGPELRDRLAQETDPINCDAMVTDRIEHALNVIAGYRPEGQPA